MSAQWTIIKKKSIHHQSIYTVGGIKTVTFPSRPVPFKRKRVPIPFNKKRELNGRWSRRQMVGPTLQRVASSNYTPGAQESRKEYYFSRSASCRCDLNPSAIRGRLIDDSKNRSQSSGDRKTLKSEERQQHSVPAKFRRQ